jgi:hypothetical protein
VENGAEHRAQGDSQVKTFAHVTWWNHAGVAFKQVLQFFGFPCIIDVVALSGRRPRLDLYGLLMLEVSAGNTESVSCRGSLRFRERSVVLRPNPGDVSPQSPAAGHIHETMRRSIMKRWLITVLLALTLAAPAWADFEAAVAAHSAGNYEKALREFKLLADQGSAGAQFNLGVMYAKGQGVAQDFGEALRWFRKAAAQGDVDAQFNLGVAYAEGKGVKTDYTEALKCYQKAASQGSASAQMNLGMLYARGQGAPQDYGEALKWFHKAAGQGHANAQFNLAQLYAEGHGAPQDYVQAYVWCSLAAAHNSQEAAAFRDQLAARMTPDQIADASELVLERQAQGGK